MRVYEKPTCSTCVKLRALLDERGVEYERIDYHSTGIAEPELREIVAKAGVHPRELLRTREPLVQELGLEDEALGEDELFLLMTANPVVLQRPIVVSAERALLARPIERVLELL